MGWHEGSYGGLLTLTWWSGLENVEKVKLYLQIEHNCNTLFGLLVVTVIGVVANGVIVGVVGLEFKTKSPIVVDDFVVVGGTCLRTKSPIQILSLVKMTEGNKNAISKVKFMFSPWGTRLNWSITYMKAEPKMNWTLVEINEKGPD